MEAAIFNLYIELFSLTNIHIYTLYIATMYELFKKAFKATIYMRKKQIYYGKLNRAVGT